jgi:toxin CcdB
MKQFDLFSNLLPSARRAMPYTVLLLSDFARTCRDRVVAPLIVRNRTPPIEWRLMPRVVVEGRDLSILIPGLTAVSVNELRTPVGSLADERDAIVAALDFLFLGI